MRVWITSFLVLFGIVELYQWMKPFTLPLPVFILGGALLAIASNYGKDAGLPFQQSAQSETQQVQTNTQIPKDLRDSPNWATLNPSSSTPTPKTTRSISFTINPQSQKEMPTDSKG